MNNLRNINADYDKFAPLISAVDTYAAQHDATVVVTGHSLGGALTQVFMANHPDTGDVLYQAATFGSPGALISATPDDRIINYEIADDPVPYWDAKNRAQIGQTAKFRPDLCWDGISGAVDSHRGRRYAAGYRGLDPGPDQQLRQSRHDRLPPRALMGRRRR